jgi:hypothetical protein
MTYQVLPVAAPEQGGGCLWAAQPWGGTDYQSTVACEPPAKRGTTMITSADNVQDSSQDSPHVPARVLYVNRTARLFAVHDCRGRLLAGCGGIDAAVHRILETSLDRI